MLFDIITLHQKSYFHGGLIDLGIGNYLTEGEGLIIYGLHPYSLIKLKCLMLGGRIYKERYNFMYVLMILSREIKLLILGKLYLQEGLTGNNLAKKLRIYHPFRIRKITEQLHQISLENLELLYRDLSKVEYGIKKGNYTEKQVFESIMGCTSKI